MAQEIDKVTYDAMLKAAYRFRQSGWMAAACEVDELVNAAWAANVHKIPDGCDYELVFSAAIKEMRRYVYGRGYPKDKWRLRRRSTDVPIGWCDFPARPERFSYDDVEFVTTAMGKLDAEDMVIMMARLRGDRLKDIAFEVGRPESWVCVRIKLLIDVMKGMI